MTSESLAKKVMILVAGMFCYENKRVKKGKQKTFQKAVDSIA